MDKKYLENKKISFVIQINGKKREVISVNNDVKEDEILDIINNNKKLKSYIENKEIIKKIFVPNKIINQMKISKIIILSLFFLHPVDITL